MLQIINIVALVTAAASNLKDYVFVLLLIKSNRSFNYSGKNVKITVI